MKAHNINIDLYELEGKKRVALWSQCTRNGGDYEYETAEDIGKAVADFFKKNFPKAVEKPGEPCVFD